MNKEDFKKGATKIGGQGKDGDAWAPGKDSEGMPRFKADPNIDSRIGYYLGDKTVPTKDGDSTLHLFQDFGGEKFTIFGTKALTDKLEQAAKKYGYGVAVCVEWLGREPMKNIREDYYSLSEPKRSQKYPWNTSCWMNWEVSVNPDIAPLVIKGEGEVFKSNATNAAPVAQNEAASVVPSELPVTTFGQGDDEDLPVY